MKFIQSTLFASLLGMFLFLGTSAMLTIKGAASIPTSAHDEEEHGPVADTKGPSWSFFNPEMDQIMADLKTEKALITAKEKQLAELSSRVTAEKAVVQMSSATACSSKIADRTRRRCLRSREPAVVRSGDPGSIVPTRGG